MISGFLTSVISSSDHASISRNALRWLLISTIFYSGFFSSEAFDKRTNRVSTDVADKRSSLYKRGPFAVRRSREGHEWTRAIMAHIVASITVFVNAPPLYLPRRYAIANTRFLRCLVPLPREWRPTGHVFLASSCLTPIRGICSI